VAFLTSCGIGEDYLDFVADHNVYKQGRFLPGSHLPVLSPERLRTNGIDAVLLLAWRQRDEVLRQQDSFRRRGGRFLVPLPEPVIV